MQETNASQPPNAYETHAIVPAYHSIHTETHTDIQSYCSRLSDTHKG